MKVWIVICALVCFLVLLYTDIYVINHISDKETQIPNKMIKEQPQILQKNIPLPALQTVDNINTTIIKNKGGGHSSPQSPVIKPICSEKVSDSVTLIKTGCIIKHS